MQEHELAMRLIKEEDFDVVKESLDDADIPIYSPDKVYVWQSGRYRLLMFFNKDRDSVFTTLSVLGVRKYIHPAGETLRYSYDNIYKLMFKKDAEVILIKIEYRKSLFLDTKTEIDQKINAYLSKIEHAKEILGEEFLNVKHYETRLKDVMAKMERFLRKEAFK